MLIMNRFTISTLLALGRTTNVNEFFGVVRNSHFDCCCRITLNEFAILDLAGCIDSGLA